MDLTDTTIAVIGLGYVGIPLAVKFGKSRPVVGFDVSTARITELREAIDRTREVEPDELAAARHLTYTTSLDSIPAASCIVCRRSER
jgi:UDP-N-acetyl-D-galactosamine dehydrogenase